MGDFFVQPITYYLSPLMEWVICSDFFVLLHPRFQGANAPVVQLNRMSDSGSEDRGFESRRGYMTPVTA